MSISTVGMDYTADQGAVASTATSSSSTYSSIMDSVALATGSAGPVVYESLLASGNESQAAIASAAFNATYSSALTQSGSSSALSTGSLGTSYSSGYYTGSPMLSTTASYSGSGGTSYATTGTSTDLSSNVEDIISETATSQAYLIGIQAQLGQQQSTFTAVSNALNVKHSMEKSAIQNFRV